MFNTASPYELRKKLEKIYVWLYERHKTNLNRSNDYMNIWLYANTQNRSNVHCWPNTRISQVNKLKISLKSKLNKTHKGKFLVYLVLAILNFFFELLNSMGLGKINWIKIFANPTHQKKKRQFKRSGWVGLSLQVDGWIYPSTTKCLILISLKMSVTIRN